MSSRDPWRWLIEWGHHLAAGKTGKERKALDREVADGVEWYARHHAGRTDVRA